MREGVAADRTSKEGRGQSTQGPLGHGQEFAFYLQNSGKALESL